MLKRAKYSYLHTWTNAALKSLVESKLGAIAERGVAARILNERAGKIYNQSPAQKRARLLGQLKFFLKGIEGQASCTKNVLKEWSGTDLTHNEVYELAMQINWLFEEVKIASALLQKLSDSKLSQKKGL